MSGGVAAQPLPPALLAALREAPLPEAAPGYWPAVARLAALGWVDDALELLGLHSAWLRYDGGAAVVDEAARGAVGALEAATLLLRRFPVLRQPGVAHGAGRELASPSELLAYRRTWQAQARALLGDAPLWRGCEAGDKATAEGLRQLLRVLCGDDAALAAAARSWLELLVAQLLHVYPSAQQPAELAQLAQRAYEAGGGAGAPEFLQAAAALLEAAAELDAQAAMRVCSALCSEWFMAHAPLLLAAHPAGEERGLAWGWEGCQGGRVAALEAGPCRAAALSARAAAAAACLATCFPHPPPSLPPPPPAPPPGASVLGQELRHAGGSQVEFYVLEYAAALAPAGPTWPLAAAYLAWCPAHGQAALEALLRCLPLEAGDAWPARKGAQIAAFQGLARVAEGGLGWRLGGAWAGGAGRVLPGMLRVVVRLLFALLWSAAAPARHARRRMQLLAHQRRPAAAPSPLSLPPPLRADIHRCQGVLCWQAGMVGAALSWLARCDDVGRIDIALRPLADAVSAGRLGPTDAAALAALQPVLETLPAGSSNAALLAVHRLLEQRQTAGAGGSAGSSSAGSMHAAVAALAQLPDAMRDSCLPLVCAALPAMPPGALSEADVRYLLQWLLVSGRWGVGVGGRRGVLGGAAAGRRSACTPTTVLPLRVEGGVKLPLLRSLILLRCAVLPAGRGGAAAGGPQAAGGGGGQHPGGAPRPRAQPGSQPHAAARSGPGAAAAAAGCIMAVLRAGAAAV